MGVLPVKCQTTTRGLVETHQQAGHGAFAAAGLAYQSQCFATLDLEAHAIHGFQHQARFALDHTVQPGG